MSQFIENLYSSSYVCKWGKIFENDRGNAHVIGNNVIPTNGGISNNKEASPDGRNESSAEPNDALEGISLDDRENQDAISAKRSFQHIDNYIVYASLIGNAVRQMRSIRQFK